MTYKETLACLYDLEKFGIKLGLSNTKRLLGSLGDPQQKLKVIHIAGTNGKGSTAAFVSSILKEAGYRVGIYTSPHLTDFTERIAINDSQIPKKRVAELFAKIKPHTRMMATSEGVGHPTFFEVTTAMAFSYFAQEMVDFTVLEVGLGGRLDATNVVEPLVSIITNSDYDHMDRLGNSLSSIACEHAGIIKKDGLTITAACGKPLEIIKKVCRKQRTRLYSIGKELSYKPVRSNLQGQAFNVKGIFSEFKNLEISLLGRHQLTNACCAIGAIEVLGLHNIKITGKNIKKGLKKARWPGRLEVMRYSPIVVLDGAHNHPAAKQLKQSLAELLEDRKRLILVIGICKDKEIEKIIKELVPMAFKVVVTAVKTSRTAPIEDIYKIAAKYNRNVTVAKEVRTAIEQALGEAKKDDVICITGSLYLVGEARGFFKKGD